MRIRHWGSFLAILGVLLHAGFVIGHSNSVLAAALQETLELGHGTVCGNAASVPVDEAQSPSKSTSKCPICMGAAPAVAMLDAVESACYVPPVSTVKQAIYAERIASRTQAALPPSRAPPLVV